MLDVAALRELLSKKWQGPSPSAKSSRIDRPLRLCRSVGLLHRQRWPQDGRYRPCRPPDTKLRGQLRELANARRPSIIAGCSCRLAEAGRAIRTAGGARAGGTGARLPPRYTITESDFSI